jgi:hypothetical protein
MRHCGLLVNFVELLDLVDVIGLGFNLLPAATCDRGRDLEAVAAILIIVVVLFG